MYSPICYPDSPPGGGRTVPGRCRGQPFGRTSETRTVTRTALREDTQTAPRAKGRNYDLSTELHTYGVIYPAGLRRPELVPTGTQTAFRHYETISWEGEKKGRSCMPCVRELECVWRAPLHLLI